MRPTSFVVRLAAKYWSAMRRNRRSASASTPAEAKLLTRDSGTPYGTFIHFDLEPRSIDAEEVSFLQQVTPLFLDYLD